MLGGQQILVGPVGDVPAGHSQLKSLVLKTMPLGQQGRKPACSWVRDMAEPTARIAKMLRSAIVDLLIRYFKFRWGQHRINLI